jgi:hypothetical protein
MKPEALIEWLAALPSMERVRELNKVSHALTICAREFHAPSGDQAAVIKKLLGLSELHHKISAQIEHYCVGEETRVYPLDVFCRVLFETALQYGIGSFLAMAVHYARTGSWVKSEPPTVGQ